MSDLYCYFGSNWGGKEEGESILDIFYKYNIAFAGFNKEEVNNYKNKFKAGTKIAVSDGTMVKAVGIAEEDFDSLDNLGINFLPEEQENFSVNNSVLAVKVKLFKLREEDCFQQKSFRSRFSNINDDDIKKEIDERLKKYSGETMKEEIKELLMQNKNLILTGAPGTGKTYLAKNIASQIILKKDYDESVENDNDFKEQCAFVQFHPSYDYTDFVEGLRPIQDEKGDIVFERKDGVFKKFCKKALKNLIDSKKDIATLNYEEIIKKYLIDFYNDIIGKIGKNGKFEIVGIGGGIAAPIIDINYEGEELEFIVRIENSKKEYKINNKLDLYVDYYKKFVSKKPPVWKLKAFIKALNITSLHTYIYGFLEEFYKNYNDKIENDNKILAGKIIVQKVEEKDFVFIIDEINRGEISKIFGELFFSVDSGYRGEKGKVKTQYDNLIKDGDEFKDGFYIPENVYIIGTMNDIDRSVESMDFAMRRRFAWKEIKAKDTQESILGELGNLKYEAIKRMDNLNNVIRDEETNLSEAYCIGAAYFKKIKDYEGDFDKLWENHLKGLLFEYTRGMPNQKEIIDNLEKAYNLKNN